jgi:hypothetical protein
MLRRYSFVPCLALASILLAGPAAAQRAPAGLRDRMDQFTHALREMEPMERIASFFPSHGSWELVRTAENPSPNAWVEREQAVGTAVALRVHLRVLLWGDER